MVSNKKLKKILFCFDSRATYSYSKNIIINLKKQYSTLITGNYLDETMGINLKEFKRDKIKITYKLPFGKTKLKQHSWIGNMGIFISKASKILEKIKPEIVVVTGDRIETLGFCLACSYMNIPIVHIQAGDKSGHIDDVARSVIAKLSNYHISSCKDSTLRLLRWGESKKRIFQLGAPQLDDIVMFKKKKKKKHFLIIFHPVLNEVSEIKDQLNSIFDAIEKFNEKKIIIYPNNDYGYNQIINKINRLKNKDLIIYKNINRSRFLETLACSKILIGNSSCGILEAPSFKIPVLNLGSRQKGRPQAMNILNCDFNKNNIIKKIKLGLSKDFKKKLSKTKNLFYKKNSGKLIANFLENLKKNDKNFIKY